MTAQTAEIDVPALPLRHCSVDEHVEALRRAGGLPFWWYQGASRLLGNYSVPFRDAAGNWWYQVKPGLCWPVEAFRPIEPSAARPRLSGSFLGFQHVVGEGTPGNSHLVINAILDLPGYSVKSVDAKRRNAVRKGLRSCRLAVLDSLDAGDLKGCLAAWNDLSSRTGWKHCLEKAAFVESWRKLADCPGVSIIVGREAETGEIAGFLVVKILADTAYVDTIASRTEMMNTNVNDAVMFSFVTNAARLPGVTKAHYAIKSRVATLERFKTGLGFVPNPFPARTVLRPGVRAVLKLLFRDKYDRMIGKV
jgi:hypothetical protein